MIIIATGFETQNCKLFFWAGLQSHTFPCQTLLLSATIYA